MDRDGGDGEVDGEGDGGGEDGEEDRESLQLVVHVA